MSAPKWSTVVLPHARRPRFRRQCCSCGAAPCHAERAVRVPWVGERAAAGSSDVPSAVDVPICGRCRLRRRALPTVWVVVLVGFVTIVVARDHRPSPWFALPMLLAAAAICAVSFFWLSAGIDVAANEGGMRWSFRKREIAEAFAADNEAVIETKAPPAHAVDEHDPDGVDHTGLRGGVPDGDSSD